MSKTRKIYTDLRPSKRTALHEAAHVVAAVDLGWRVAIVTIEPTREYNGYMQLDEEDETIYKELYDGDSARFLLDLAYMLAAPYWASERLYGVDVSQFCYGDRMQMTATIKATQPHLSDEAAQHYASQLRAAARPRVQDARIMQAIYDFAVVLRAERTIEGPRAMTLASSLLALARVS